MSVNSSTNDKKYGITIDVPEILVEELISKKKKPSNILSNIVKRMAREMKINELINYAEGLPSHPNSYKKIRKEKFTTRKRHTSTYRGWNYPLFEEYMNSLLSQERLASIGDVLSMLIAYFNTSPRPTSEELRNARAFTGSDESWYEELRTSKARLTIAAKHLGLSGFFLRAYGSGMNRRHPMNEEVYSFLCKCNSNDIFIHI